SQATLAVSFDGSEYHGLTFKAPAPHVTTLATDVRFVKFNRASERLWVGFFHGLADSMAEVPRRFVADMKHPLQLIGGDPFFRFDNDVRGEKPLGERQVRIV